MQQDNNSDTQNNNDQPQQDQVSPKYYDVNSSYESVSINHLMKYPKVADFLYKLAALPFVIRLLGVAATLQSRAKTTLIESPKAPSLIQPVFSRLQHLGIQLDELFNLLVFTKGVDSFINDSTTHDKKAGVWIMWFFIDYMANFFNTLLHECIIKPFKFTSTKLIDSDKPTTFSQDTEPNCSSELPHLAELSTTTRTLSKDLQNKVANDYINPGKDAAIQKYETLVKPTAEKIEAIYITPTKEKLNQKYDSLVKPTYDSAMQSYNKVSTAYENNLSKTDSIPKAIVSTGVDLGKDTIERLGLAKKEIPAAN